MVVVVARDTTVQRIKNHQPRHSETQRLERLKQENLPHTKVRLGRADGNFWETIREESPSVICLGYDQRFDESKCRELFPQIQIIRSDAYHPEFFKSSKF
jgi:glycerol-3-phosphate cytidylyltransferase-like family protein